MVEVGYPDVRITMPLSRLLHSIITNTEIQVDTLMSAEDLAMAYHAGVSLLSKEERKEFVWSAMGVSLPIRSATAETWSPFIFYRRLNRLYWEPHEYDENYQADTPELTSNHVLGGMFGSDGPGGCDLWGKIVL